MNTVDSNEIDNDENTKAFFSFSSWLNVSFWQILRHKWQLVPAALFVALTYSCLLISGLTIIQSSQGNIQTAMFGAGFMLIGWLSYPPVLVGFFSLLHKLEYEKSNTATFISSISHGIQTPFYKLIGLGGFLIIGHIILIAFLAFVFKTTENNAIKLGVDLLSETYLKQLNVTMGLCTLFVYPVIASPFVFSPLTLIFKPETSVLQAMLSSIQTVLSQLFSFALFILFSVFIFSFFLICLSIVPSLVAGILSLLPWSNPFAVAQKLFIFPAIVLFVGFGFCIAWFFAAIYQAYLECDKKVNSRSD